MNWLSHLTSRTVQQYTLHTTHTQSKFFFKLFFHLNFSAFYAIFIVVCQHYIRSVTNEARILKFVEKWKFYHWWCMATQSSQQKKNGMITHKENIAGEIEIWNGLFLYRFVSNGCNISFAHILMPYIRYVRYYVWCESALA